MTENIEAIEKKAIGHLLIPSREGALEAIFLVVFRQMIEIVFQVVVGVLGAEALRAVGKTYSLNFEAIVR